MSEAEKAILIRKKIERASAMLSEIRNLIPLGYYETALNRIYYCCFYCVSALLADKDVYPKSHKGVLINFNLHFVKENRVSKEFGLFYQNIFDLRMMADYDDNPETSK
jgi:uncharacterized protein (UPF0332 family)